MITEFSLDRINRRRTLAVLGAAGVSALFSRNTEALEASREMIACTPVTPQVTEGPYWVDEKLFRSDIRTDPSTGVARPGVPLDLSISVQQESGGACTPLVGALVDIWHCDAVGIYSDESAYNPGGGTGTVVTSGQKFLRGYQITDSNGQVQFTTVYPGWYSGRTIHIHVRVRTYSGSAVLSNFVTQVFFDDTISSQVLQQSTYKRTTARDTTNANDMVYRGAANPERMLATLMTTSSGYSAAITIGSTFVTPSAAAPAVTTGGVVNAASGAAGLAPGTWTSIYGTNLAASTYAMASTDVSNGNLPTTLSGVSVLVAGKPAYVYYVSPTQINVLTPSDTSTGPVSITITNAAGTSSAANATLKTVLPGLFTASNYVRAVRPSDGSIVNGTGATESGFATVAAAKPGDVLELYGTGFGAAASSPGAGQVFSGAYATDNPVTVTIGGVAVPVAWAGLVGPGLYQINITVPAGLPDGDHALIATVGGATSQPSALLRTAA